MLLRGASDTARILCQSFTPRSHKQLRSKNLPEVPSWRLERESNSRPFGRKATNLPKSHHAPQYIYIFICLLLHEHYVRLFSGLLIARGVHSPLSQFILHAPHYSEKI